MKIALGSDERAHLTDLLIEEVKRRGHEIVALFGPVAEQVIPWPDVALGVAESVAQGQAEQGILCCWTGTGVSMAANKVPGIRAALCQDAATAAGARTWNHANVLCLSLRAISEPVAKEILEAWFSTPDSADPTDQICVSRMGEIERTYMGQAVLVQQVAADFQHPEDIDT